MSNPLRAEMAGGSAPGEVNCQKHVAMAKPKMARRQIDRVLTLEPFSYPWNRFSPRLVGG